jgi:hypothetical protein
MSLDDRKAVDWHGPREARGRAHATGGTGGIDGHRAYGSQSRNRAHEAGCRRIGPWGTTARALVGLLMLGSTLDGPHVINGVRLWA